VPHALSNEAEPAVSAVPQAQVEELPQQNFPPLSYTPPQWASPCKYDYQLEVLKNGAIVETLDISEKDHLVVGRLPNCDLILEHEVGALSLFLPTSLSLF